MPSVYKPKNKSLGTVKYGYHIYPMDPEINRVRHPYRNDELLLEKPLPA